MIVGVVLAAVAIVVLAIWWQRQANTEPPPTEATPAPAVDSVDQPPVEEAAPPGDPSAAGEVVQPPVDLPPLADSDTFVRERIPAQDAPLLTAWLANEGLVHVAATVIANAAEGKIPKRILSFVQVQGKFAADESGAVIVVDSKSFARYDDIVDSMLRVPPERLARLFAISKPLLAESLAELGIADPDPRALLDAAIAHVLDTPIPTEPIALERPKVFYEFADAALEARSPLQKQLLRMGPANAARVQAYARALQAHL